MAGGITSTVELSYGMEKDVSVLALKAHSYGTRGVLPDGRVFRYAFSDGAVEAGWIMQAGAQPTADAIGEYDMDVPISTDGNAIGDRNINVDFSTGVSTIVPADEWADGLLYVNDGPGEGHVYRISSHSSGSSDLATVLQMTLADDDTIRSTALTTLTLVGLIKNQYKDVAVVDDDAFTNVVGATPAAIPDNRNFWLQTWGPCALLITAKTAVPVLGGAVVPNVTTSDLQGSVTGISTLLSSDTQSEPEVTTPTIGFSMAVAAVDTDFGMVFLQIAP